MTSPAKPWERQRSTNGTLSTLDQRLAERNRLPRTKAATLPPTSVQPNSTLSSSTQQPPALPRRPSSLSSVVNRNASAYSPYARNPYSTIGGPYGGAGYSPYNRFGASSMYGGGGMYGGGMYGGGMYGGMGGMPGGGMYGNNGQMGLTESMSQSTQATFQMIESLVGAFGGFAQMLESTYMATHSSFFGKSSHLQRQKSTLLSVLIRWIAMVSVAEQFSNLKTTLGSLLGIFTLLRYLRTLLAKLTGRPPPADATSLTPSSFQNFLAPGNSQNMIMTTGPNGQPVQKHKPSRKPLMIFLLAIFGLPYLMGKLIKALSSQQSSEQTPPGYPVLGPNGLPLPNQPLRDQQQIDPRQLTFCRALFDYTPPQPPQPTTTAGGEKDLPLKKGDLVAILSKVDPITSQPSEWWKCRSRKGDVGWVPGSYLEEIQRRPAIEPLGGGSKKDQEGGGGGHSRVSTMTTADPVSDKEEEEGVGGSRSTTMTSVSSSGGGGNEGVGVKEKEKDKGKGKEK